MHDVRREQATECCRRLSDARQLSVLSVTGTDVRRASDEICVDISPKVYAG